LDDNVPALNAEVEDDAVNAWPTGQSLQLLILGTQERCGFGHLAGELIEIGIAGYDMDAGTLMPSPLRLACWKHWSAAPLDCTHRQRATSEKSIDVKGSAVCTQDR
jgi:hypothetical protein